MFRRLVPPKAKRAQVVTDDDKIPLLLLVQLLPRRDRNAVNAAAAGRIVVEAGGRWKVEVRASEECRVSVGGRKTC